MLSGSSRTQLPLQVQSAEAKSPVESSQLCAEWAFGVAAGSQEQRTAAGARAVSLAGLWERGRRCVSKARGGTFGVEAMRPLC